MFLTHSCGIFPDNWENMKNKLKVAFRSTSLFELLWNRNKWKMQWNDYLKSKKDCICDIETVEGRPQAPFWCIPLWTKRYVTSQVFHQTLTAKSCFFSEETSKGVMMKLGLNRLSQQKRERPALCWATSFLCTCVGGNIQWLLLSNYLKPDVSAFQLWKKIWNGTKDKWWLHGSCQSWKSIKTQCAGAAELLLKQLTELAEFCCTLTPTTCLLSGLPLSPQTLQTGEAQIIIIGFLSARSKKARSAKQRRQEAETQSSRKHFLTNQLVTGCVEQLFSACTRPAASRCCITPLLMPAC